MLERDHQLRFSYMRLKSRKPDCAAVEADVEHCHTGRDMAAALKPSSLHDLLQSGSASASLTLPTLTALQTSLATEHPLFLCGGALRASLRQQATLNSQHVGERTCH